MYLIKKKKRKKKEICHMGFLVIHSERVVIQASRILEQGDTIWVEIECLAIEHQMTCSLNFPLFAVFC